MPTSAPKACRKPGCGKLVRGGNWCEAHRPAGAAAGSFADTRRGSRHERGYGTDWDKTRPRIIERDNGLCQRCLREGRMTPVGHAPYTAFVDHIVPKFEGGTDDDDNLETLCRPCHTAKTDAEKTRARRRRGGGSKV